jgi:hypothetical protein
MLILPLLFSPPPFQIRSARLAASAITLSALLIALRLAYAITLSH